MTYHSKAEKILVTFPRTNAWTSAELMKTEEGRVQGLHGRTMLGANESMLFYFPEQRPPISMTMAKMLIPLDILFISGDGKIEHIAHRLRAGREAPVLGPAVTWVLETPAGFARKHRLVRGDVVNVQSQ